MKILATIVLLFTILRLYITIKHLIINGGSWDTLLGVVLITWGIWFFEKYRYKV